jgi:hypothetical protein|tara:strand:- start:1549 stop:2184 length:636 start_codon:yes stop_codon:yes gene_type:complete
MRVLELDNNGVVVKYELPTSWSEVSLGQYSKLMTALENEEATEIESIVKTLEALVGISTSELTKVPLKYLKMAYAELTALTSTMPSNELNRIIDVEGTAYGFIPDFDALTFGEFCDLDNYLQDSWNNLDKIMAVLFRRVVARDKDKYSIEEYTMEGIKERRELFNSSLSIDVVYAALVFFCNIGSKHIKTMRYSLEEENKRIRSKLLREQL